MLVYFYDLLVTEKDFFSSLAAIATVFALVIPLPVFVISSIIKRRDEARERAFNLISQATSDEMRFIRDAFIRLVKSRKLHSEEALNELSQDDENILREFMNNQEIISIHLNTSRVDERIFFKYWKSAFLRDWEHAENYIQFLRSQLGNPKLYVEWEKAIKSARMQRS